MYLLTVEENLGVDNLFALVDITTTNGKAEKLSFILFLIISAFIFYQCFKHVSIDTTTTILGPVFLDISLAKICYYANPN